MPRATYLSWLDSTKTPTPAPWDLEHPDGPTAPVDNAAFLAEVFSTVESEIERQDPDLARRLDRLKVVVTPNPAHLDETGPHVIAMLWGDNFARVPYWADDVGLVMAVNRGRRFLDSTRMLPRPLGWAELADEVRVTAERAIWARQGHRPRTRVEDIFAMPLGYSHQRERPFVPWEEREIDAFFAGSTIFTTDRGGALRQRLRAGGLAVKTLHRNAMVAAMESLRDERPDLNVLLDIMPSNQVTDKRDEYSDRMAQTRFSIDPRGTSRESFRFFEAARVGAVPVVTSLPSGGLYAGAPALRLRHWTELGPAMRRMTARPEEALALHEGVQDWYRRQASPEATAQRLVPRVKAVLRRLT
ncbi:hypothetical protein [uncultured Cellulomonas sp.]|uniref:hypothetical protein n=1 Tax=uncultured Cellulomonas sp. TaxID=189682 RepID=UPI002619FDA8|nr:hypothetical protein [uncultured Cellulomonas sp.]